MALTNECSVWCHNWDWEFKCWINWPRLDTELVWPVRTEIVDEGMPYTKKPCDLSSAQCRETIWVEHMLDDATDLQPVKFGVHVHVRVGSMGAAARKYVVTFTVAPQTSRYVHTMLAIREVDLNRSKTMQEQPGLASRRFDSTIPTLVRIVLSRLYSRFAHHRSLILGAQFFSRERQVRGSTTCREPNQQKVLRNQTNYKGGTLLDVE